MKIVYVDTSITGHHIPYMSSLISANTEADFVLITPEKISNLVCKQYVCNKFKSKDPFAYIMWMREVCKIVKKENPNIVHFLYGDVFYRYFGVCLSMLKRYKTIVTLHWARTKKIEVFSTKRLCKKVSQVVVHSEYIKHLFEQEYNIHNVCHIEYPQFNSIKCDKKQACDFWGISDKITTIACIGNTRYDKGLDLLLEALKPVKKPYQLLVAGKAEAFDEKYIRDNVVGSEKVKTHLEYLSDDELAYAIGAADIIALPYRRSFNGASGPLGEGVALNKCIIGPKHGVLGYTIERYHLGYVFDTENLESLSEVLERAVEQDFVCDDQYIKYQKMLDKNDFNSKYSALYLNCLIETKY